MRRGLAAVVLIAASAASAPAQPGVVEIPDAGITVELPVPATAIARDSFATMIGGELIGFAVRRHPGWCADAHLLAVAQLAEPTLASVPAGYWGTPFKGPKSTYLCFDLRDDYVTVMITPSQTGPDVDRVLLEIRRAALAAHGDALRLEGEPVVLPRTQQTVRPPGGRWKVLAGERFKVDGGDVLVPTASLAEASFVSVGVVEGPCTPGKTELDRAVAARFFPAEIGPVWAEDARRRMRWRAHACIDHGGQQATVHVLGAVASDAPPEAGEELGVLPLVTQVAASYGLAIGSAGVASRAGVSGGVVGGGAGSGTSVRSRARVRGFVASYLGAVGIAPVDGERRYGGVLGLQSRIANAGGGAAAAFAVELGYGSGELIGEVRAGGGFALGSDAVLLDAIVGVSIGSTGPAAPLDAFGEVGLGFHGRRNMLWIGALHAIGAYGVDHTRVELRLGMPAGRQTSWFLGARYTRFGEDGDTMMGTGDALLVTGGFGMPYDR